METAGNAKVVYVRAGTYPGASLSLTSADNGQTWSYYPPDGYNSAVLDGGASGMNTGNNVITVNGTSNLTIDGLTIQNFKNWGIGVHGGPPDVVGGFTTAAPTAGGVTVINNIVNNGYTANSTSNANSGWSGGGIYASGSTTDLHILNNVVTNQYANGIRAIPTNSSGNTNPNGNQDGLTISNNVVLMTNQAIGDGGAIYVQDINFDSTGITISNNFIRDYQSSPALRNSTIPTRDVAIYLDEGACNVTITGNIIGATSNAIASPGPSNASTMAFYSSSGHNNIWMGNIVDLGTAGVIQNFDYEIDSGSSVPTMSGNSFTGNIFIGNWSGSQDGYGSGSGPSAYGGGAAVNPTLAHNLYYNYGTGSLSTTGPQFADPSPINGRDPLISGTTYTMSSGSPAFSGPMNFTEIAGHWGPPGYVIPDSGTAPSP